LAAIVAGAQVTATDVMAGGLVEDPLPLPQPVRIVKNRETTKAVAHRDFTGNAPYRRTSLVS
jgi:hypothetical protein